MPAINLTEIIDRINCVDSFLFGVLRMAQRIEDADIPLIREYLKRQITVIVTINHRSWLVFA